MKGEHYAAVEVCDRGTAGGECLDEVKGDRGTKPFDGRHRDQWDPRLDGGSTSLIVASRGTPELTAAARPRDQDKGHQDWRSTDLPHAPAGPGGGIRQLVSGDWHLAASGTWWHLTTSHLVTSIRHSASPLEK